MLEEYKLFYFALTMDSTMLPWSPQAVQLCSGFRSVSEIIEATGRFYEVYGGTILKQSLASIRGTIQHPDLPSTEVKVKVFLDKEGGPHVYDVQRRSGDSILYWRVYSALLKYMIPFAEGKQVKLLNFIVPRAPVLRPLPDPVEEEVQPPFSLPPAAMDQDVYYSWPQNDIKKGSINKREWSDHIKQVPRVVRRAKKLPTTLPPGSVACDRLDMLISEGLAHWAVAIVDN